MARLSATSSAPFASNGQLMPPKQPVDPTPSANDADADDDGGAPVPPLETSSAHDEAVPTRNARPRIRRMESTSSDNNSPIDAALLPGGSRDLSLIGAQAFALGNGFASGICLMAFLLATGNPWWRLPAFIASLSMFHYLEYWTTARYNTPACEAASFLLYNNGRAYTLAHSCATVEIVLANFFPAYRSLLSGPLTTVVGAVLVVSCQLVRSLAMVQAATNFNHQVATKHKQGHVLVTDGLYAYLRHPSYFGYFWWAIGTQMLVGNKVCLVAYGFVLWNFFSRRIKGMSLFIQ